MYSGAIKTRVSSEPNPTNTTAWRLRPTRIRTESPLGGRYRPLLTKMSDTDGSIACPSPRKGHPTYVRKGIPPYARKGIPTYVRKGLITYAGKGLMSSGTLPNKSDEEGNTSNLIRVPIPRNGKVNPNTPKMSKNPKRYGYY
ncbi:hypothetical protein BKA67DRAFT_542208 [Truncatella angustata]|uniref:Uncharacterized protein n=1 Tax=Truncatella angustata TaxID=152316 RepID=A0A9P8RG51_9PEZI|nr:uncharacterized protein BKA67DRAFT_542208 [Truncatella angustata]KAH6645237.1 hypothetical protein BKA67DRAFT_542208 [Truncatella angustata]